VSGGNSSKGRRRREERGPTHPGFDHDPLRVAGDLDAQAGRSRVRVRGSGFRRNAANPRTGSGMQQARGPSRGGNHRGGEKPRGWNEAGRVVPSAHGSSEPPVSGPERVPAREWTRKGCVGGGANKSRTPGEAGSWSPVGASTPVGRPRGTRQLCGRFVGEGKGVGVPTKGGSPPGSDAPVLSSRAPDR
jgi:hypothetical protein